MGGLSFDIDAVIEGKTRLGDAQALEIYHNASMQDLGSWALAASRRLHPEDYRTYVIDRNINYTNVCTAKCTFCAFRRDHDDADAYTLTFEQIGKKVSELVAIGGTQILMQGGMNDRLPIEYYEEPAALYQEQFPCDPHSCVFAAGIRGVRAILPNGRAGDHSAISQVGIGYDPRRRRGNLRGSRSPTDRHRKVQRGRLASGDARGP